MPPKGYKFSKAAKKKITAKRKSVKRNTPSEQGQSTTTTAMNGYYSPFDHLQEQGLRNQALNMAINRTPSAEMEAIIADADVVLKYLKGWTATIAPVVTSTSAPAEPLATIDSVGPMTNDAAPLPFDGQNEGPHRSRFSETHAL